MGVNSVDAHGRKLHRQGPHKRGYAAVDRTEYPR